MGRGVVEGAHGRGVGPCGARRARREAGAGESRAAQTGKPSTAVRAASSIGSDEVDRVHADGARAFHVLLDIVDEHAVLRRQTVARRGAGCRSPDRASARSSSPETMTPSKPVEEREIAAGDRRTSRPEKLVMRVVRHAGRAQAAAACRRCPGSAPRHRLAPALVEGPDLGASCAGRARCSSATASAKGRPRSCSMFHSGVQTSDRNHSIRSCVVEDLAVEIARVPVAAGRCRCRRRPSWAFEQARKFPLRTALAGLAPTTTGTYPPILRRPAPPC